MTAAAEISTANPATKIFHVRFMRPRPLDGCYWTVCAPTGRPLRAFVDQNAAFNLCALNNQRMGFGFFTTPEFRQQEAA